VEASMSPGQAGGAGDGEGSGREAFGQSRACFEELITTLADPDSGRLTHAQMEEQLTALSRELVRTLHQDSLDLRTVREKRRGQVTGSDQVRRGIAEHGHDRGLATVFGEVRLTRMAYRRRGVPNLYPADAVLNLPAVKHSHGLARLAAIEAPRGSFDQATAAITRATGARIGKRQLEQLAIAAAADVDAYYAAHRPAASASDVLLVMSYDGKGIVMRPEALREATAKAAAGTRRKLATRLSPGEKNGRKRMAELGCVYDCVPVPRTAADIITRPGRRSGQPRPPKDAPAAAGKWLTTSITADIPAVITAGFAEAHRRDPAHQRTWIALVDGNRQQIEAIDAEAARHGVQVTILIDFIHVLDTSGRLPGRSSSPVTPVPKTGSPPRPPRSFRARPPRSPLASAAAPPPTATPAKNATAPTPARATSPLRHPTWIMRTRWPAAGRSPPASSRAPAAT